MLLFPNALVVTVVLLQTSAKWKKFYQSTFAIWFFFKLCSYWLLVINDKWSDCVPLFWHLCWRYRWMGEWQCWMDCPFKQTLESGSNINSWHWKHHFKDISMLIKNKKQPKKKITSQWVKSVVLLPQGGTVELCAWPPRLKTERQPGENILTHNICMCQFSACWWW